MGDLKSVRRELSKQISRSLKEPEVYDLVRDLGDADNLLPKSSNVRLQDLIAEHIRTAHQEDERIKIVETYLDETYVVHEDAFDGIFDETKYDVAYIGDNVKILDKGRTEANELNEKHNSYIEENANQDVNETITKAQNLFAKAEYENTCTELRHALEAMTAEGWGYNEALDELVSENVIQNDDNNTRDRDTLYLAYSYNSNIGAHKNQNNFRSYRQQAEFSMVVVVETIYFILKVIEEGKGHGKEFERWNV